MPITHHLNIKNAEGNIYCCLRNKVVKLDDTMTSQFCSKCGMFGGLAGGQGVECLWEDARDLENPYVVTDPYAECRLNQRRKIDAGSDLRLFKATIGAVAEIEDMGNSEKAEKG